MSRRWIRAVPSRTPISYPESRKDQSPKCWPQRPPKRWLKYDPCVGCELSRGHSPAVWAPVQLHRLCGEAGGVRL